MELCMLLSSPSHLTDRCQAPSWRPGPRRMRCAGTGRDGSVLLWRESLSFPSECSVPDTRPQPPICLSASADGRQSKLLSYRRARIKTEGVAAPGTCWKGFQRFLQHQHVHRRSNVAACVCVCVFCAGPLPLHDSHQLRPSTW